MKSVLASFKPRYCELIASGRKTAELRKNRPKLDVPFKVYIYQTKERWIYKILEWLGLYQGKVIGEFVCDNIIIDRTFGHDALLNTIACLDVADIAAYCTNNPMYGWHISDLVIYDKPKDLSEFYKPNIPKNYSDLECIKRPPQSWCYVEELEQSGGEQ